jgi:hypothetical protein
MAVTVLVCDVKRGLFKCTAEAVGVCQYCGRPFCGRHCDLQEDGEEVCARRFCVEKRRDLARHLAYKSRVAERNRADLCGLEGCRSAPDGVCTRCKGYYCGRHIAPRQETIIQNGVRLPTNSTLCGHCWSRRPIWTRV